MAKRSKQALITGMTGMVGSHMAEYLLEHTDWDVVGMTRWRSPLDNLDKVVGEINTGSRVRLVYADLRDEIAVTKAVRDAAPDYIFHLAAQSYPKTSFDSPLDTMDTNILGTARLLEAVRQHAPDALVHVCASSEVFGRVPSDRGPIGEDEQYHPASPYAISKIGTDLLGRYYAEAYGVKAMVTRMFTHTGARRGDVFAESTFAKQIAMIEHGLIPPVVKVGNLKSIRTVANVRDAVRAYYMLLTVSPQPGEYYNIGGTHTCTIGEILDELVARSTRKDDIKIEVDKERLRPLDADFQIPDTTKFRKHTGWEPELAFEQTIQELLDYWRDRVGKGMPTLTR